MDRDTLAIPTPRHAIRLHHRTLGYQLDALYDDLELDIR
jgi:hypothetical protein